MSFFGGGFGQGNQQKPNTGFGGGFGSNNNTTGGFGSSNTGFGSTSNNTGTGLFGNTSSGFGTGGFGSTAQQQPQQQQSSPFGGFGSNNTSTSGGLFGSNTATAGSTGFGGFGSTNTTNTSTPFGSSNTGGGLFGGANKPAFGNTSNTSGGLFGSGSTSSPGFGGTATTGAFGSPASTALGGSNLQCEGTGSTPFSAYTEKDTGSTQTNHFQSITFQQPYQKFSFEELRLADYTQGRRYGNASGQPGAFGTNTGFGGFGNTSSGFGNTQNNANPFGGTTSSPFGAAQNTTSTGFGSNTGGGLFGTSKPAGGLFGSNTTTAPATGGLFGTSNTSGFGGNSSTGFGNSNTSGGLFGNNNQQQQNQNKFGGFGAQTQPASTGFGSASGGFGTATSSSGGGLFGGSTTATASPFGAAAPQQGSSFGGGFGAQQNTNQGGGLFGGGFGANNANNQQKPGGAFGSNTGTSTGGGLFGNQNNQQQPSGGLFGSSNNNQAAGGLFGSTQSKPATGTTGGLFGNNNNNQGATAGGNLFSGFGNQQNQQNQSGGLFGNPQQPKPGGLFGSTNTAAPNTSSGGLFGSLNNNQSQQPAGSLFGSSANTQPQQQSAGNSAFGGSSLFGGSQTQQTQQPPALTASVMSQNPYGHDALFSSLSTPSQSVGPLVTPLSSSQKLKKNAILPQYKINPNSSARFTTPQKRGYGFTYSTYGTPSSASSNVSTPGGLGNSLLSGSYGRSLGKSLSTSNLRRNFDANESILSPGAFSASSSRYSNTGSLKRLTINRNIRADFFGSPEAPAQLPPIEASEQPKQPSALKKRVSFDTSMSNGSATAPQANGGTSGSTTTATPSAEEQGFLRSSSRANVNGAAPASTGVQTPEMEQVQGNELAVVPEDEATTSPPPVVKEGFVSQEDKIPGDYYTKPSLQELKAMPREKLRKVSGFEVGRVNCGQIVFDVPVDLTTIDLDNLWPDLVKITLRVATVYPDNNNKPPMGKGLNVPATITLQNSWPRAANKRDPLYEKHGPIFNRHIERLKRVVNTKFVMYNKDTGEWTFKVEHFTTYGLDYDDETEGEDLDQSTLSAPPETPTPKAQSSRTQGSSTSQADISIQSGFTDDASELDDTFDFKRKVLPGAFDKEEAFEEDEVMEDEANEASQLSFLGEGSVGSSDPGDQGMTTEVDIAVDSPEYNESVSSEDQELTGSYPNLDPTMEPDTIKSPLVRSTTQPKSILKSSHTKTPPKLHFHIAGNWTEQLQRSVSPKKLDRRALRESQAASALPGIHQESARFIAPSMGQEKGFSTSIDLMHSLFGEDVKLPQNRQTDPVSTEKGFKWPYQKKTKLHDGSSMDSVEEAFHRTFKPRWGSDFSLLCPGTITSDTSLKRKAILKTGSNELQLLTVALSEKSVSATLVKERASSTISIVDGVPYASLSANFAFRDFARLIDSESPQAIHERLVWELASVLFDDLDDVLPTGLDHESLQYVTHRTRKDRLTEFWKTLVATEVNNHVRSARSAEERALAYLTGNQVVDACLELAKGGDQRLATLIATIGENLVMREDIVDQLGQWRRLNALSEINEPIRALYELIAGNVCVSEGKKGPPEDFARTFTMSDWFDLDWKRAFGLRLWYAILESESLEMAVKHFTEDLESGKEPKAPIPWFSKPTLGGAYGPERNDLLWGLLQIYSHRAAGIGNIHLEDILSPQSYSPDLTDVRLGFQLHQAFSAKKIVKFSGINAPGHNPEKQRADQLALDFANQLHSIGEWTWALFVAMHLSIPTQRKKAILDILGTNAEVIGDHQSQSFQLLVNEFLIPASWVWEAKALYVRSVSEDYVSETMCLLRAQNWSEAHTTLCRHVGPRAVIEQDYQILQGLLSNFAIPKSVDGWNLGGQVYLDFIGLVQGQSSRRRDSHNARLAQERNEIVQRLVAALPAMARDGRGNDDLLQKVAVREMSGVLVKTMMDDDSRIIDGKNFLQLPLTEDHYLKYTIDLSLTYFQTVLAGAR